MAENSENIEAKLCAYVEGDLDDAGRVEIERHLEAHPNHRRLLHELMATRDLLRFLPREQAPPELAEAFNAQLERSALLDGEGIDTAGSDAAVYRANLMPRLMAMAAVVMLAVGLGVLVYFALPRGESGTQLVLPTTHTARPTDLEDAIARGGSEGAAPPAAATPPIASRERMAKVGPSIDDDDAGKEFARKDRRASAPEAEDANRLFGGRFTGGGGEGSQQGPVYVIVSADNLDDALREVTDNLSQIGTRWESASEPPPVPLNVRDSQVVMTSPRAGKAYLQLELDNALQKKAEYGQRQQLGQSLGQQRDQLQKKQQQEFAGAKDDAAANVDADIAPQQAAEAPAEAARGATTAPSAPPPSPTAIASAADDAKVKAAVERRRMASNTGDPSGEADALAQAERDNAAAAAAATAAPSTRPSDDASQAVADARQGQVQEGGWRDHGAGEMAAGTEVAGVVAYGMTPRQVVELSRKLNRAPQAVEVIADNEELQVANESLKQEQELQRQSDAFDMALAEAAPATPTEPTIDKVAVAEPTPSLDTSSDRAKREVADAPAAAPATPAPAGAQEDKTQVAAKPSAQPASPGVAMKAAGPGAAAGAANRAGGAPQQQQQRRPAPTTNATMPQRPAAAPNGFATMRPRDYVMARQGTGRPRVIVKGEKLSVTIDELAGPDMGSTHPATVAPDGTVRLPKLSEPVAVDGLSREEAEVQIAKAYKAAQVIDAPTVSVARATTGAADVPRPAREAKAGKEAIAGAEETEKALAAAPVATTAPTTTARPEAVGQFSEQSPTTQATESHSVQTQPAEEEPRLDVVILVQKTATAATSSPAPADEAAPENDAPNASQEPAAPEPGAAEPAQPARE